MTDGVFVAVPVYRGAELVAETLRSIAAQTLDALHVVMSVDGADDPSIGICEQFTSDPRFDVVVQQHRLGWPGNLNWLIERCDRPFFCYWQQDDLASTNYLEVLRQELLVRQEAAIAYTDVQWFGARFDRTTTPSIEGEPLHRVLDHIEAIRYEPLRGLMRRSMLPSHADPIPVTVDESCQEEFVFLTEMAAAGSLVRTDQAMYFKRLHDENVFVRWFGWPNWRRRRGWISMGAGMHRVALGLAGEQESGRLLALILDRLAVERPGRAYFYRPPQIDAELTRFVRDFVAFAGVAPLDATAFSATERRVHPAIVAGLDRERHRAEERAKLARQLSTTGAAVFGPDRIEALLGYGWHVVEPWGVWSEAEEATLALPTPPETDTAVAVEAIVFGAPGTTLRVGYAIDGGETRYIEALPEAPFVLDIDCAGVDHEDRLIRFHLPDARSPKEAGVSGDGRVLGIGVTAVSIERR